MAFQEQEHNKFKNTLALRLQSAHGLAYYREIIKYKTTLTI